MTRSPAGAVLITGATGFVGRHVVDWFMGRGSEVVAAVRREFTGQGRAGVTYRAIPDVGPGTNWQEALVGVDRIVHLAAHVHITRAADPADFRRVNVEGTRQLAEQAASAGVKTFLFVSSIKVNGETTFGRPFRAEDTPHPMDEYGRSKLLAERELWRIAERTKMGVVIIRPVLVYGPGAKANFARLVKAVEAGIPLPFGSVRNARSLISVWNLAALIGLSSEHPDAVGRVWLASDGEDLSTPELVRRIAFAMNRRARIVPVPVGLLRLVGTLTGQTGTVRRLTESLSVDSTPARMVLGFRPPLTVDEALHRSVVSSQIE